MRLFLRRFRFLWRINDLSERILEEGPHRKGAQFINKTFYCLPKQSGKNKTRKDTDVVVTIKEVSIKFWRYWEQKKFGFPIRWAYGSCWFGPVSLAERDGTAWRTFCCCCFGQDSLSGFRLRRTGVSDSTSSRQGIWVERFFCDFNGSKILFWGRLSVENIWGKSNKYTLKFFNLCFISCSNSPRLKISKFL